MVGPSPEGELLRDRSRGLLSQEDGSATTARAMDTSRGIFRARGQKAVRQLTGLRGRGSEWRGILLAAAMVVLAEDQEVGDVTTLFPHHLQVVHVRIGELAVSDTCSFRR